MRVDIFTLFPELFPPVLGTSIVGRARKKGVLQICCHQLRDFSLNERNHKVDDTVFGGGKGMLLAAEPFARGIDALTEHLGKRPHIIYMSPRGKVLSQPMARRLAQEESLAVLCGHYEGVDERLLEEYGAEEISIGDYVLTGGELPAMILTDAVSRMLPGVLAGEECFTEESHFSGLLEYPQYTRPEVWRGREVPAVLLSGHHENVRRWRRESSLLVTARNRPDLLEQAELTEEDRRFLETGKKFP
ncbi:tRNA (guanosine(37)-N1)-methyltransferase TrmD [uncultured Neglectibacter sp.]|uniref:tRNA (guanosine(37)-N1)-methyltransferase TrmD n=1 Tax=uncultured Neglectibacter sp. TaxID=1924108 RepID=UPI0034DEA812